MTTSVRIEHHLFQPAGARELSRPLAVLFQLAIVALGVALYAASAQFKVQLPFTPVPLTGQTFAIFLISGLVGMRLSTTIAAAYLGLGFLGAPVFAGGAGGFLPTAMSFGYLWGFLAASALMGFLASRGVNRSLGGIILSLFLANLALYLPGIAWMGILAGWDKPLLEWGLLPFIAGDLFKMALAFGIIGAARKLIHRPSQES